MIPEEEREGGGGGFSLWGFGSSVLGNVAQNATSFVNTIVETDWNKELQEIQEGIKEDTQTLEHEVEKKLGINHARGEASTSQPAHSQQPESTGMITEFGRRLVTGTAEIFQQVRQQVDAEFTNLEQEAAKKPRSTFPKRAGTGKFSRIEFQLTQLQRSGATYCDEPAEKEQYAAFLDSYDEEARRAEAEQTLASNSFMADLHSRLVPLVISDDTFWQRYFFRVQLLKSEHEKRGQRLRRAHRLAGSEAGELPLDEPFDNPDTSSPTATAAADPAAAEAPAGEPASTQAAPTAKAEAPASSASSEPAAAPAEVLPAGSEVSVADGEQAGPASDVSDPSRLVKGSEAAESAGPSSPAAGKGPMADKGAAQAAGQQDDSIPAASKSPVAVPDGSSPAPDVTCTVDNSAGAVAQAPGTATEAVDGGNDMAASGACKVLHARVESPVEGEEHACGSSAGGSAARSPQSSGNVVSSEWSIVSGSQAPTAAIAAAAHGNGVMREPVPAVEEGEEGSEDINVQEEDVNFDDLDSLGGDVDDNGEDAEEEIDENWGQWE